MAEQRQAGAQVGTVEAALQIAQQQLSSLAELARRKGEVADDAAEGEWVAVEHRLSLLQRSLSLVGERLGSSPAHADAQPKAQPKVFVVLDCGIPEQVVVDGADLAFESIHIDGLKDDDDQWEELSAEAQAYVRETDAELAADCERRWKEKRKHLYGV